MGRRRLGERVLGPYRNGGRWTVEHRKANSERVFRSFTDFSEAVGFADELRSCIVSTATTIAQGLDAYERFLISKGNKEKSWRETIRRLRVFYGPVMDLRIDMLTKERGAKLYKATVERYASADSHRNMLLEARSFLRWCKEEMSWIRENPLEGIRGEGRRKRGPESKTQLRFDEGEAWLREAVRRARAGDDGAIAAILTFVLNARCSEIVTRQVRDVDGRGRLLWITKAKTRAGERVLEIPELLRDPLLRLTDGRPADAWLFPSGRGASGRHDRDWPRKQVKAICRAAMVTEVTAHGMRGLHSTILGGIGVTGHLVAAAMGHESYKTTERSYADPATLEAARRRGVFQVLAGGLDEVDDTKRKKAKSKRAP